MLIRIKESAETEEVRTLVKWLIRKGLDILISRGRPFLVIVLGNHLEILDPQEVENLAGVEEVLLSDTPLGLAISETSSALEEFEEGWCFLACQKDRA